MRVKSLLFLILLILASCSSDKQQDNGEIETVSQEEGIYYWKTIFNLSDWDKEFIKKHGITKIYLRLFDVDLGNDYDYNHTELSPIPIATTRFDCEIPDGIEIVPVVYITSRAINNPNFADKLYERVKAMAKKNGFADFKELQLDCDWANSTEQNFFQLCQTIRDKLHADGKKLSATIRLHQLKKDVPPVDQGVLMIYNTGSLYEKTTTNSILKYEDVEPYLKSNIKYNIPLSCAYPVYSWGVLLDCDYNFRCILHNFEFDDPSYYKHIDSNFYKVIKAHKLGEQQLYVNDVIRCEVSNFQEIQKVKQLLLSKIETEWIGSIIYHLDSHELSRYSDDEINSILN